MLEIDNIVETQFDVLIACRIRLTYKSTGFVSVQVHCEIVLSTERRKKTELKKSFPGTY